MEDGVELYFEARRDQNIYQHQAFCLRMHAHPCILQDQRIGTAVAAMRPCQVITTSPLAVNLPILSLVLLSSRLEEEGSTNDNSSSPPRKASFLAVKSSDQTLLP